MAELVFFTGTMECGSSSLALQMDHNHIAHRRSGLVLIQHDRAVKAVVSSRLGLRHEALEVVEGRDLWDLAVSARMTFGDLDYVIADEVQFYEPEQIYPLARVVDALDVDVFAFGITADFRTQLFREHGGCSNWPTAPSCSRWMRCAGAASAPAQRTRRRRHHGGRGATREGRMRHPASSTRSCADVTSCAG